MSFCLNDFNKYAFIRHIVFAHMQNDMSFYAEDNNPSLHDMTRRCFPEIAKMMCYLGSNSTSELGHFDLFCNPARPVS